MYALYVLRRGDPEVSIAQAVTLGPSDSCVLGSQGKAVWRVYLNGGACETMDYFLPKTLLLINQTTFDP